MVALKSCFFDFSNMGRGQTIIITITTTRVPPARGGRERSNPATTTTHSGMGGDPKLYVVGITSFQYILKAISIISQAV